MKVIRMKPETEGKWKTRFNRWKRWGKNAWPYIAGGIGLWYVADGAVKAHEDHKTIRRMGEVIDHNATAGNLLRERVSVLERQNNVLLEKALSITEGKETE